MSEFMCVFDACCMFSDGLWLWLPCLPSCLLPPPHSHPPFSPAHTPAPGGGRGLSWAGPQLGVIKCFLTLVMSVWTSCPLLSSLRPFS